MGQGRPDSFASKVKVQRSAVGSGSGRNETARPMSRLGREPSPARCWHRSLLWQFGSLQHRMPRAIVERKAMPSLVGVSKLVEARAFDDVGQEVPSPLGPHPMGVAIIDAERIMAMAGDGRTALPPEVTACFRDARHAELSDPAVRLGDFDPFDRLRLVGSCEQLRPNACPVLTQVVLGVADGHPIDARTAPVLANAFPRSDKILSVAHLLHQLFRHSRAFGCWLRRLPYLLLRKIAAISSRAGSRQTALDGTTE